jgi:hypothetical protein
MSIILRTAALDDAESVGPQMVTLHAITREGILMIIYTDLARALCNCSGQGLVADLTIELCIDFSSVRRCGSLL